MIAATRPSTPSLVLLACCLSSSVCLAAPASVTGQFTPFEAAIARFDAEVAAGVAEDAAGAVSIAVFDGDRVLWSKGWGWADIERLIAADARTIGRTGSISKTFTATLALQLHERGVIDLDDPVVDYLPEIRGPHAEAPASLDRAGRGAFRQGRAEPDHISDARMHA